MSITQRQCPRKKKKKKKNVHSARITTQTAAIAVISRRRWNNFTAYSESYKDSRAKKHLVFQAKPRISYFKQTSAASMRWWLGSSVSRWCITSTYLSSFLFKAATVSTCGAVLPKYLKRSEFDNSENLTTELLDFIEHSKLCTYLHIIFMHRTFYAAGQTLGKKYNNKLNLIYTFCLASQLGAIVLNKKVLNSH